ETPIAAQQRSDKQGRPVFSDSFGADGEGQLHPIEAAQPPRQKQRITGLFGSSSSDVNVFIH
ncbi:MAG: hypothetical protein KGQ57_18615, partial [Burkholderiales bacterium]|nr:hypothetical protein [Burkholderiales bacterium]